tara:strand:+ start:179 stop:1039 length:861 start_codon:yes stop_codon:yes gene_type:complete
MAEVENIQEESVEPTPNPYNLKKDWHTDDVMPKHGETAEGLFFEKPQAKSEPEPVQADTVEEDKAYSQPNYKKRYDDLKKHYDSRLSEFKQREQELIAEATANRPEYQAPKTAEELEQFKAEYPDVYEVVETVAHLQSEDKVAALQQRLDALQERETEILKREAEKDLIAQHPDFEDIRNSDEFHTWAESQPEEIKDWIYNNPNNASLASKAIDLFKLENGLAPVKPSQNKSVRSSAADMVSTKTTTVDEKQPKIWTQQEIAALPMAEYDRLEKEIDKAVEEGRVI